MFSFDLGEKNGGFTPAEYHGTRRGVSAPSAVIKWLPDEDGD